jgi:hypothetical protein
MPKAKSFSVPKVQNIQHKEILLPTTWFDYANPTTVVTTLS